MEHKFQKLLFRVTYFLPEYFPIHEGYRSASVFLFLKDRMEQLIKGRDAVEIDRAEFESHTGKNEDLTETYFEMFSMSAKFFKCKFHYDGMLVLYYIMFEKRIKLIYFRKFEIEDEPLKDSGNLSP